MILPSLDRTYLSALLFTLTWERGGVLIWVNGGGI